MSVIEDGDHIYTPRAGRTYAHHGILVGDDKVLHFNPNKSGNTSFASSGFMMSVSKTPSRTCTEDTYCGFMQPKSGVVISCLNCFLKGGDLYRFDYNVNPIVLCRKRGGSCTTAKSDEASTVIQRATYLLCNGFGDYNLFANNCEDFSLYCKTGLLIVGDGDSGGSGRSGQISSIFRVASLAAITSCTLVPLIPIPVAAMVSAGIYCLTKYTSDIGVRKDVMKINVKELVRKCGWMEDSSSSFMEYITSIYIYGR